VTASTAERYARLLDAVTVRVHSMICDRARYAPDVMEWTDGACDHCDLLDLLESEPSHDR
jgi:hypothetical protein